MKKFLLVVAFGFLVGAGCEQVNLSQDTNTQPLVLEDNSVAVIEEKSVQTEKEEEKNMGEESKQKLFDTGGSSKKYIDVSIKKFEDGGYGSFDYYIEPNGERVGLIVCDQRLGGFQQIVEDVYGTDLNVDIYGSATEGGVCLEGIIASLDFDASSYTGTVKNFPNGGVQSFQFYVEEKDNSQTGLSVCDKRLGGFNKIFSALYQSGLQADIYGLATTGGICVNGVVLM
jgi:hypothetical protein